MKVLSNKIFKLVCLSLLVTFCCCHKNNESDEEVDDNNEIVDEPEKILPLLGDVTDQVIVLGNPLKARYKDNTAYVYARNIWDMHAFNNKIYFGGGNSSNSAPAANAGPADLWTFDPASQSFTKEYTVADEQIHRIREFDHELYIPGHDAREDWSFGNFYRLEADGWKKYRTIPDGIHVYDIYKWENKLFAAIGPNNKTNSVLISEDDGKTWSNISCPGRNITTSGQCACFNRIYTLFTLCDSLYVPNYISMVYTGKDNVFTWLPKISTNLLYYKKDVGHLERPVVFNKQSVYILGDTYNDHQYLPLALMRAQDRFHIYQMNLPENALPRDILVLGKWLVILVSAKEKDNTYRNTVLITSDISTGIIEWKEIFNFSATTYARSFEYLNGVFYLGLGCDTSPLVPETGNILSIDYDGL